jgi:hypothetical protein
MKHLFRIFELSKNEQRVVLIVLLALIVGTFVSYERRSARPATRPISATEPAPSPSPPEAKDEH